MKTISLRISFLLFGAAALFLAQDQTRQVDRFSGSAKVTAKNGGTKEARVTVRQISVSGKQRADVPLDPGFHLVTLRAGKVTTLIDGKEENHTTDEFWTVKENSRMAVTVGGETAVLEVISLVVR
jgi:FtsP/CotA-like multicopper oxidase with cupredoxin domain